ncbi:hypothetical protein [Pseudomonas coronafaciens]|uniref:hypothetical protein n=1 Tax=Pseudomonas coronafaciens TaxID=53409 RepID=UPI0016050051|nr:hypothetical protein [Pseudomonas coronafaciens]
MFISAADVSQEKQFVSQEMPLLVAACNRNGLDLQSSHFSTGINCVYPSQQTEIICE